MEQCHCRQSLIRHGILVGEATHVRDFRIAPGLRKITEVMSEKAPGCSAKLREMRTQLYR